MEKNNQFIRSFVGSTYQDERCLINIWWKCNGHLSSRSPIYCIKRDLLKKWRYDQAKSLSLFQSLRPFWSYLTKFSLLQAQFRLTLLSHLQLGLVTGSHTIINKNPQLNVCIESTTLKLITGSWLPVPFKRPNLPSKIIWLLLPDCSSLLPEMDY